MKHRSNLLTVLLSKLSVFLVILLSAFFASVSSPSQITSVTGARYKHIIINKGTVYKKKYLTNKIGYTYGLFNIEHL